MDIVDIVEKKSLSEIMPLLEQEVLGKLTIVTLLHEEVQVILEIWFHHVLSVTGQKET